jgi:hypothetical protein
MPISIIYKDIINGYIYISAENSTILAISGIYCFQIPNTTSGNSGNSGYLDGNNIKNIVFTSFTKEQENIKLGYKINEQTITVNVYPKILNQFNITDYKVLNQTSISIGFESFVVKSNFNCFVHIYKDTISNMQTLIQPKYILYYHDTTISDINNSNGTPSNSVADTNIQLTNSLENEQIIEQELEKLKVQNEVTLNGLYIIDFNIKSKSKETDPIQIIQFEQNSYPNINYAYINIIELNNTFVFGKLENSSIEIMFNIKKYNTNLNLSDQSSASGSDKLTLKDLIAIPLDSIIQTNSDLNIKQFNDNLSLYFDQTNPNSFLMRSAYFSYNTNLDETISEPSVSKLPLITLLDYNRLNVNDATVEFTIDAKEIGTNTKSYIYSYANSQAGSVSGVAGSVAGSTTSQFSSQIKMKLNIKKDDEPPGLSKLKSILTDKIKFG